MDKVFFKTQVIKVSLYFSGSIFLPPDRGKIAAAVYRALSRTLDSNFFSRLHSEMRYKPFVWHFSGTPENVNGHLVLHSPVFLFSSLCREIADAFIEGVQVGLDIEGTFYKPIEYAVESWHPLAPETIVFAGLKVHSPVVASRPAPPKSKMYILYEQDPFAFAEAVTQNLARKASALVGISVSPENIEFAFDPDAVRRQKRCGARIYRVNGGSVMGYKLPAVMRCPAFLLSVVLGAGLGERNAQGFGYVDLAGMEVAPNA